MANDSIALISKSYLDRNTVTSSTELDAVTQVGKYVDAQLIKSLKEDKANVVWVHNDYDDVEFSDLNDIYDYIRKCRAEGYYLFDYFFHSDMPEKTIVATQCTDGDVYFFTSLKPEYDSLIDPKRPVVKKKEKKFLYNGRPVIKKHMPMCPNERLRYFFSGYPYIKVLVPKGKTVTIKTNINYTPIIEAYDKYEPCSFSNSKSYRTIRNHNSLQYLYTESYSYNNQYRALYIENLSNDNYWVSVLIESGPISRAMFYVSNIEQYYNSDNYGNITINFFYEETIVQGNTIGPTVSYMPVHEGTDIETISPYVRLRSKGTNLKLYLYNGLNVQPDCDQMIRKIGDNEFAVNNIVNIPGLNGESGSYRQFGCRKYEHRIRKRRKLLRRGGGYYHKIRTKQVGNLLFVHIHIGSMYMADSQIKLTYKLVSSHTQGDDHNSDPNTYTITVPITKLENFVIDLESNGLPEWVIYQKYYYLSNVEIFEGDVKQTQFIWITKPVNKLTSYKKMSHNDYDKLFSGYENGNPKLVNRGKAFCLLVYPKHKGIKSVRPIKFYYNRKNFMS